MSSEDNIENRLGVGNSSKVDTTTVEALRRLVDNSIWMPIPAVERLQRRTNLVGGGIDRCSIAAMEDVMRDAPEVLKRFFSPNEIAWAMTRHSKRPAASLAGAFAAKEAGFKAGGFNLRGLVVLHGSDGKPYITLEEGAQERASTLGVDVHLWGISHELEVAEAWVVLLDKP